MILGDPTLLFVHSTYVNKPIVAMLSCHIVNWPHNHRVIHQP